MVYTFSHVGHMTKADYAKHRGVSRQAVHNLIKRRHLPVEPDGCIDPQKADAHLKRYLNPLRGGKRVKAESAKATEVVNGSLMENGDLQESASLEEALRVERVYKAKLERGKFLREVAGLVDAKEIERQAEQTFTLVSAHLFRIPGVVAEKLPTELKLQQPAEGARKVCQLLSREIGQALEGIGRI